MFMRKIKATEVIEQERLQLWNDYQIYLKVEQSDDLKTYLALKEKVESIPFQEKKKELESLRFKGSPEEKMVKHFNKQERNRKLTRYFELKASPDFDRFMTVEKSGVVEHLKELEKYMKSGQYKSALVNFKRAKKHDKDNKEVWEQTEAYAQKKEFEDIKSSPDILFYNRFKKSGAYKNYIKVDGSSLLNQFEDLKTEVESEKFKARKAYLEDKNRYEKTDDFKLLTQYNQLNSNSSIQLYMKYNDTDAFKFFRDWQPTFTDDFETINKDIWSYITPFAEKGPGRNFTIKGQLQYPNLSDNFDVENSILTLETKREKVEGLAWDETFGFVPKTFDYVSGIAHSLKGFTQEYGYFTIKIKASRVKGVISSVSLVDENEDTCIRIFTANGGNIRGGIVTTDHQSKNFTPISLKVPAKGYMIISLKWTPEKLEWHVNEKHAGTLTDNVPHTPLGLRIETEVLKDTSNLPHRLDIDWIKCYKKNR